MSLLNVPVSTINTESGTELQMPANMKRMKLGWWGTSFWVLAKWSHIPARVLKAMRTTYRENCVVVYTYGMSESEPSTISKDSECSCMDSSAVEYWAKRWRIGLLRAMPSNNRPNTQYSGNQQTRKQQSYQAERLLLEHQLKCQVL